MSAAAAIEIKRLEAHVRTLAAMPRPPGSAALDAARWFVVTCLEESDWNVSPVEFEALAADGVIRQGRNLLARHVEHPVARGPRLVLGAHLDSLPDTPGADDNASAVAALLEIARALPPEWPEAAAVELELVVFDLEEYGMLGGAAHAEAMRTGDVNLRGMVSLEMLGYCDPSPGSQTLPAILKGQYPDTGDFIAVIGNEHSRALIDRFRTGMQTVAGLPVESLAVPGNGQWLQATRLSDHSPFWDAGYAALMITDTSFLRNPHYHLASDTPDTLDFEFLRKVTAGCLAAVRSILAEGV